MKNINELMDEYIGTDDAMKIGELEMLLDAYKYLLLGKTVEFYDSKSTDTMVVMHIGHRDDGSRVIFWKRNVAGTCAACFESMVKVVMELKGDGCMVKEKSYE